MIEKEILKKYFGHDDFRFGQLEIIRAILNNENVLAILPTGAGKSICYQIPALMHNNFSIVISPLIALMKDQVDSLNKVEEAAAFINSTLDYFETEKVLREIESKKIKLLYLAPEKLNNLDFAERLKSLKPEFLFIDEAHCISEWGHNFRPSYRKINEFAKFIDLKKTSAFTATATPIVREDIIKQLQFTNPKVFVRGFERENLNINVINAYSKKETIAKILRSSQTPCLIYTATRKLTEATAEYLRASGWNAEFYHAGLSADVRKIIQDRFIEGKTEIVVATNAFGMGIDKRDIRTLIHANIPSSIENYYQEIGRAGRDNEVSDIYLLFNNNDKSIQEFLIDSSYPTKEEIVLVYNSICNYGNIAVGNVSDKSIVIKKDFFERFIKGMSQNKFYSAINILINSGYLKESVKNKNDYFVKSLLNQTDLKKYIKNIANDELKDTLVELLRLNGASIFLTNSRIEIEKLSEVLDKKPELIKEELEELNTFGIIEFDKPSFDPSYELSIPRINDKYLNLDFSGIEKAKNLAVKKLDIMMDFVFTEECRMKFILDYFGENLNSYKCGKCDICTNKHEKSDSDDFIIEKILESIEEFEDGISKNDFINLLIGDENSNLFTNSYYGVCGFYSKFEIANAVELLISNRKIDFSSGKVKSIKAKAAAFDNVIELYNKLKTIRAEAGRKFNQLPEVICPDNVLKETAEAKPSSIQSLLKVKGFNQRMFNKFGEEILEAIKEFNSNREISKIPSELKRTFDLVQNRYKLVEISSALNLSDSIISMQIESMLKFYPDLEISFLIDRKKIDKINEVLSTGLKDLKSIKEKLNGSVNYAEIRIVMAKQKLNY